MNSPSTTFPCLLLMLGRGRGPSSTAPRPSALGAQGRMPNREGSDARMQNTPTQYRVLRSGQREGQKYIGTRKGAVLRAHCQSGSTPSLRATGTSPKPSIAGTATTPRSA